MLLMGISQIRGYQPGDAEWGVKLEHVRGQAEAKEEIRRIVTLWQSGERFERSGGKRERGLLFLGAPGTGKTMLAKAIATGFNSPFVTIPGSGFAQTFVGLDSILVRYLARKAKRLARKWGGQCIVFIDEIDAVGMRRSALGGSATPSTVYAEPTFEQSGDLVLETRAWRDKQFELRAPERRQPNRFVQFINQAVPGVGGMFGGGGGMALNQLLVVMDGLDSPPLGKRIVTNTVNTLLDAMYVVPPAGARALTPAAAAAAAQRADLLHRRHERPDRAARSGSHAPGTDGPARLVPHADQAGPRGRLRPLPRPRLARPGPRPSRAPRRARAHDDGLFAGDDRAGLLDGADRRASHRPGSVRLGGDRRRDDDRRVRHRRQHRVRARGDAGRGGARGGPCRRRARVSQGRRIDAPVHPAPRRLARPPHGAPEGGALLVVAQRGDGAADLGARRDGRGAGVLRRELDGRRRRRAGGDRPCRLDGRRLRHGARVRRAAGATTSRRTKRGSAS